MADWLQRTPFRGSCWADGQIVAATHVPMPSPGQRFVSPPWAPASAAAELVCSRMRARVIHSKIRLLHVAAHANLQCFSPQ